MKIDHIEYEKLPVTSLNTFENNPRRGDVAKIAESLDVRGQYRPIVVNRGSHTGRSMEVLAGNHTLAAARELGWDSIDVGIVDVDDETARSIVVADNRLADLGDYDEKALAELLDGLDSIGTGYTDAEIDALVAANEPVEPLTDEDDAPAVEAEPISAPGDVFRLGRHMVWCGDSTDSAGVAENLLSDGLADCVWTDPPYGVSYVGKTKDSLTIQNDGSEGLADLLEGAFGTVVACAKPGAPVYVAHADTARRIFEEEFVNAGCIFRQNLVWVKNTIVMGRSDYHYKHEPILFGNNANFAPEETGADDANFAPEDSPAVRVAPYIEEHENALYGFTPGGQGRLGRGGSRWYGDNKQSTVLEVAKPARNSDHPTMKPVELVRKCLKNSCPPGGVVLDLFGGSGTTLIAAHHHGSKARLVELDPKYVDVICRRFQQHTGIMPVRVDGDDFVEVDFSESE